VTAGQLQFEVVAYRPDPRAARARWIGLPARTWRLTPSCGGVRARPDPRSSCFAHRRKWSLPRRCR